MKVKNEVDIYELNGAETKGLPKPKMEVLSHWNYKDRIVIKLGDNNITILADDLERAIKNSCNHKAF